LRQKPEIALALLRFGHGFPRFRIPKIPVILGKRSHISVYSDLNIKGKAVSTITSLEWPRGFQEVKVPRFHDNSTGWW
jgi:hypothetical protein